MNHGNGIRTVVDSQPGHGQRSRVRDTVDTCWRVENLDVLSQHPRGMISACPATNTFEKRGSTHGIGARYFDPGRKKVNLVNHTRFRGKERRTGLRTSSWAQAWSRRRYRPGRPAPAVSPTFLRARAQKGARRTQYDAPLPSKVCPLPLTVHMHRRQHSLTRAPSGQRRKHTCDRLPAARNRTRVSASVCVQH